MATGSGADGGARQWPRGRTAVQAADRPEKAIALGLTSEINTTLSAAWGSSFVNDFLDHGRVKKVYVQGEASARMMPDDFNKWYMRGTAGIWSLLGLASAEWTYGVRRSWSATTAFLLEILASCRRTAPAAMAAMEALAAKPPGVGFSGPASRGAPVGLAGAGALCHLLIVVFLCLAALYESWSIPASVMLVVPLGVLGAVAATWLRGLANDVYFQVGLLTTIGLSTKNAILIVEFAIDSFDRSGSLKNAALQAATLRLRPILMTSLAFILGVLPLAVSSGAGPPHVRRSSTKCLGLRMPVSASSE